MLEIITRDIIDVILNAEYNVVLSSVQDKQQAGAELCQARIGRYLLVIGCVA